MGPGLTARVHSPFNTDLLGNQLLTYGEDCFLGTDSAYRFLHSEQPGELHKQLGAGIPQITCLHQSVPLLGGQQLKVSIVAVVAYIGRCPRVDEVGHQEVGIKLKRFVDDSFVKLLSGRVASYCGIKRSERRRLNCQFQRERNV